MKRKNAKRINWKLLGLIGLLAIVLVGGIFLITGKDTGDDLNDEDEIIVKEPNKDEKSKFNIVDTRTNSRTYAVMVNNIKGVWGKQAGLQDAYIVYEITVEGGITRFLALYRDANTAKIGSVRSARPYYIDYVLENDAIYNHVGGSTQAKKELKTLGINHMESYTRDKSVSKVTEYTAFTSIKMMTERAKKAKYRTTSKQDLLLNYSETEIDLSSMEGAKKADEVIIGYNSGNRSYKYDSNSKTYLRYQGGDKHVDYVTKKQYTVKNIITYKLKNYTIAGDKKGRQVLENLGSGQGYYITNGWAVPIKWSKKSRSSQTVYTYLNGEEIKVNDGNTFIQIEPTNKNLEIKQLN